MPPSKILSPLVSGASGSNKRNDTKIKQYCIGLALFKKLYYFKFYTLSIYISVYIIPRGTVEITLRQRQS